MSYLSRTFSTEAVAGSDDEQVSQGSTGNDNKHISQGSTNRSNDDVDEVEEIISNFGPANNIVVNAALAGDADETRATAQGGGLGSNGALQTETYGEFDSISVGPIQNTNARLHSSTAGSSDNGREETEVEPHSLACPQASTRIEEVVEAQQPPTVPDTYITPSPHRTAKLSTSDSTQASPTVHSEPPHAPPSPATAEGEHAQATKLKKRRRKGPRLTRVKNERAKKMKAKAAARHEEDAKPQGHEEDVEMSIEEERPVRRLTRAAAKAAERAEANRMAEAATRKNKGKGKAKDLPKSDAAATGSKRSRDDDDDNTDDAPQTHMDPGPSRGTRRTRRRVELPVEDEAPIPALPPNPEHTRRLRTRAVATDVPAPTRDAKRHRSMAPEPSEGLIQAARKRSKIAGSQGSGYEAVATSSHNAPEPVLPGDVENKTLSVKLEETESESSHDVRTNEVGTAEESPEVEGDAAEEQPNGADDEQPAERDGEEPVNETNEGNDEEARQWDRPALYAAYNQAAAGLPVRPIVIQIPEAPFLLIRPPGPPLRHTEPPPTPPYLPPPGRELRRHETTIIGRNVYRPNYRR